jgi:hypothetical protein
MAIGYRTPQEGQAANTGNHTVWIRLPGDKKWYSPKDISGMRPPSDYATHQHLGALKREFPDLEVKRIPRSNKKRLHRKT